METMNCQMCGHEHVLPGCPECGEVSTGSGQSRSSQVPPRMSGVSVLRRMATGYLGTTLGCAVACTMYFDMTFRHSIQAGLCWGTLPSLCVAYWVQKPRGDGSFVQGLVLTALAALFGLLFLTILLALMYLLFRMSIP